ncbi:MAG: PQQ-binding-like beta-propeller repeat protein [Planctomycetaceae bacterium]|nr:PQQ-binding-like beta-propeller repeat protein [Planctomycetaceae bacterium]
MQRRFRNRRYNRHLLNGVLAVVVCLSMSRWGFGQQQPQNPLNRLFNNIDKSIRGEEEINGRLGRDAFDIRTPQNPDNARRLSEAERYVRSQRWNDAVEVLQFLLDQPQDSLIFGRGRTEWSSLRQIARDMLRNLPDAGKRSYESRFGPQAEQLLAASLKSQNETLLHEVVRRFGALPAGLQARRHLISLLVARGDIISAQRLLDDLPEDARTAETVQLAACMAMQSQMKDAIKLLDATPGWQSQVGATESAKPADWLAKRTSPKGVSDPQNSMGTPLLIPAWSASRIARFHVEEQVYRLERDLTESRRGILPMSQAVFSGNLMIYRDLAGIKARDLTTGELAWQHLPENNIESRLVSNTAFSDSTLWQESNYVEDYEFPSLDHHPLGTALFRDAVTSGMTVHEGRLYTIERQNPLESLSYNYYWQRQNSAQGKPDWAINELVCRQATTGRRLWAVGGPELEPLFSRSLAGAYFLGPPTLFQNQLLVLADLGGEINLYALSPSTGEPLWNQLVAAAGRPLAEDPVRRMWRCQPVIANGQILCPTGVGWLVALDAYSHSVSWVYRYPPHDTQRRRFRSGYTMNSVQPLLQRWGPQLPLAHGNRILLAPPELPDEFNSIQPSLVCLDEHGKLVWQEQKRDAMYVAGVYENRAIVVTRTALKAYSLDDGAPIWETQFTEELGLPYGRGVGMSDQYLLPFADGKLGQFHLRSGELQNVFSVPAHTDFHNLGNLEIQNGRLVSLSAESISVFPSVEMERSEWNQLGKTNPRRVLRETQLMVSQGKHAEALTVLNSIAPDERAKWASDDQNKFRSLKWDVLMQLAASDDAVSVTALGQLRELAETESERRTIDRFAAAHLEATGDVGAAVRIYLNDLTHPASELVSEGDKSSRPDVFASGRLRRLLEKTPVDGRAAIHQAIEDTVNGVAAESFKTRDQLALALSFHPAGCRLQEQLANEAAAAGRITEAALRYRRIVSTGLPEQKAQALVSVAEMYDSQKASEEALSYWSQLATRNDLPEQLADGANRREIAQQHLQDWSANRAAAGTDWESAWRTRELLVDMTSGQRQRGVSRLVNSTAGPWRFLYEADVRRLQVEDRSTGRLVWSLPLRSLDNQVGANGVGISGDSTFSVVTHLGVVHALGIPDQTVLWRYTPNMRDEGPHRLRSSSRSTNLEMKNAGTFLSAEGVRHGGRNGFVLAANEFAVLLQLRDLVVLDTVTGEVLWREANSRGTFNSTLVGATLLQSDTSGKVQLRQVVNGMPLEEAESSLVTRFNDMLQIRGTDAITLALNADDSSQYYELKRASIVDNVERWSHRFVRSSLYAMVNDSDVAVLEGDGRLVLVNLERGELQEIGSIPQQLMSTKSKVYLLADTQRLFAVVEHKNLRALYINMPTLSVSGSIIAFSRQGDTLWSVGPDFLEEKKSNVEDNQPKQVATPSAHALALPDFEQSPVLVFLEERVERPNGLFFRKLRVTCVDKETGKVLLDWTRPSDQNGFHRMEYNQLGGWLDLESSGLRVRIHPTDELTSSD